MFSKIRRHSRARAHRHFRICEIAKRICIHRVSRLFANNKSTAMLFITRCCRVLSELHYYRGYYEYRCPRARARATFFRGTMDLNTLCGTAYYTIRYQRAYASCISPAMCSLLYIIRGLFSDGYIKLWKRIRR